MKTELKPLFMETKQRVLRGFLVIVVFVFALQTANLRAAICTDTACVEVSGRLATIDTGRSVLLNALLGQMLGTSVSLSVVDWQALAGADVNLLDMLQVMQVQGGVGTPEEALNGVTTLAQVLNASASALQAQGSTVAANALVNLALQTPTGSFRLADLLTLCAQCTSYAAVKLNALDLVQGSASLFNHQHMLGTPTPITLSGSSLGLGATITSVKLYAQIDEPAIFTCGPSGTSFFGAAIRLKLDTTLVSVDLNALLTTLGLNLPAGVANLNAKLTNLSLFATIARAQGTLDTVDAIAQAVTIRAKPGLVDLYIGAMDDTVFFNRNHAINATTDLQFGVIGSLSVTLLGTNISAAITGRAAAEGDAPFFDTRSLTGPYPQTANFSSSAFFVSNLVTTLLNTLQINVAISSPASLGAVTQTLWDTLMLVLKPLLLTVNKTVLSPVLGTVLNGVVDPALWLLGIRLGQASVTVTGVRRRCTYTVSGSVYKDANRSGNQDTGELGTNLLIYAKLISSSAPTGPALQAVAVNSTSGAYSFTTVDSGSYIIAIDDNATLADIAPMTVPQGWIGTEQPTLTRTVAVPTTDVPNQNFGLTSGSTIKGRVFLDTGKTGGVANDGVLNGAEAGIAGSLLRLLNGAVILDSATTAADGSYTLVIPSTIGTGTALRIAQTNTAGRLSMGASVGSTNGVYDRTTDTVTFTATAATHYINVNFGDVPDIQLISDGQQNASAGSVVIYTHQFVAGTSGAVNFSVALTNSSAADAWSRALYLDANSNGVIDAAETPISASINVTAGQTLALILKVSVPSTATVGARSQATLVANFDASGATPALSMTAARNDLTLVSEPNEVGLVLIKTVDKTSARPGDALVYSISYANRGVEDLKQLVVYDSTPAFTRFVSAAAVQTPAGLTLNSISVPVAGGTGAIRWNYNGILSPGANGSVTFSVTVDQ